MTKKRSSEILERIEGNFFKICCLKINFPKFLPPNICDPNVCLPIFVTQIFAPNIYDKSTPVVRHLFSYQI